MGEQSTGIDTQQRILDVARGLVQTRGFNAFSYGDIARELKVTKASLHYHFASKADLGHSLIADYEAHFRDALAAIDASGGTATSKVNDLVGLYDKVLANNHMCLCGMLAAEFETLPRPMQSALDHFFEMCELWLEEVLVQGQRLGEFHFKEPGREVAQYVIATLEGAMLLARSHGSQDRFRSAARKLVAGLSAMDRPSAPQ